MFKSQTELKPDFLPRTYETGIYTAVVDSIYLDESTGGAYSLNVSLKTTDGRTLKQSLWITSGKAKGVLTYYVDKQGEKKDLPGFAIANALAQLTTGKELGDLVTEEKLVSIYNYDLKKDVPTPKQVYTDILGKVVNVGIRKITEFKRALNQTTGQYEDTSDTRDINEIEHVFKSDTNQSLYEYVSGKDAVLAESWNAKNTNVTRDKTKARGATGGVAAATPKPTTSLFNK